MLQEDLPATNRWYTFAGSLEVQTLLSLLSGILPRVRRRARQHAAPAPEDAADLPDNELPYPAMRNQKDRKSAEFLCADSTPMTLAVACVATEAVDKLSNRLQHLDHVGNSLGEAFLFHGSALSDLFPGCDPVRGSGCDRLRPGAIGHLRFAILFQGAIICDVRSFSGVRPFKSRDH